MKLSIADLRKGPREIEINLTPAQLDLAAAGFSFPARVTGHVRFYMVGSRALAQGHLETPIEMACVRCLRPISQTIRPTVRLVFEKRPSADGDKDAELATDWEAESHEFDYYDEDEIDPSDPFRQLLLLELPNYPLCNKDCRGLCPQCGTDLNQGECTCADAGAAADEPDWKARLRKIHLT